VAEVTQELRDDIERIREDLDTTLDALGERVSPRRIAQRRKDAVRARVTRVRTAVMGSAGSTASSATDQARRAKEGAQTAAGHAVEKAREAPEMIQHQAQGNPLAAGLIAFGAGMLLATLFPPTQAERRAASELQDRAEPLKDRAVEAGREVKDHLQESARESAQQVKETATEAAEEVKRQAQASAQGVKEQAQSSTESVKDEAASGKARRP
jgi:hypothetical protein